MLNFTYATTQGLLERHAQSHATIIQQQANGCNHQSVCLNFNTNALFIDLAFGRAKHCDQQWPNDTFQNVYWHSQIMPVWVSAIAANEQVVAKLCVPKRLPVTVNAAQRDPSFMSHQLATAGAAITLTDMCHTDVEMFCITKDASC